MDWDDLRYVAALARAASLAAVAQEFGVAQTTVARRVRALELELGLPLFEHRHGRWTPTPMGDEVRRRAGAMERDLAALVRWSEAAREEVSGVVRLTALDFVAQEFLIPALPRLLAQHADLRIELVTTDQSLDLARREADIAVKEKAPFYLLLMNESIVFL